MRTALMTALIAAASLSGCATKEFVLEEAGKVDRRVAALEQALTEAKARVQDRLKKNDTRMDAHETQATAQDKRLAALGEQHAQTNKTVAENTQRLQGAEKTLQLVRVDLSATQSHLDSQGKQVVGLQSGLERVSQDLTGAQTKAQMLTHQLDETRSALDQQGKQIIGLQTGVDTDKQAAQQVVTVHDQRIAGTEQGLQKVGQDLAGTQAQTQALTQQIDKTNTHVAQQGQKVDTLLTGLDASRQTLTEHTQRLQQSEQQAKAAETERVTISATANDALARANAAGKLAEGKLMYASVLNHEMSGFKLDHAELGDDAKAALKDFVAKLKAENANVYLEIQGHTDTSGKAETNRLLSLRRAEAVRDFLYAEGCIALHRMAVFAYGGKHPIADNKKREGRVQNRRVVIVVLK